MAGTILLTATQNSGLCPPFQRDQMCSLKLALAKMLESHENFSPLGAIPGQIMKTRKLHPFRFLFKLDGYKDGG